MWHFIEHCWLFGIHVYVHIWISCTLPPYTTPMQKIKRKISNSLFRNCPFLCFKEWRHSPWFFKNNSSRHFSMLQLPCGKTYCILYKCDNQMVESFKLECKSNYNECMEKLVGFGVFIGRHSFLEPRLGFCPTLEKPWFHLSSRFYEFCFK
jgi:hypothetical protein